MAGGAWLPIVALVLISLLGCELIIGPRWAINRTLSSIADEGIVDESTDTELEFRFVSRTVDVEGARATVYARGEVSGSFEGVTTDCICVEAIPLEREGGRWRVVGFPLPRLRGVVAALEARHEAFEERDVEAYRALIHPDYDADEGEDRKIEARLSALLSGENGELVRQEILSRTMRVERREATVTERWRLIEEAGEEPRELARGRARYVLHPTTDGWRFVAGLM